MNLTRIIEVTDSGEKLSEEEAANVEALRQICTLRIKNSSKLNCSVIQRLREIKNDFVSLSTYSLAYAGFVPFSKAFKEIITAEGVCYSFNMLDEKDFYKREINPTLRLPKVGKRSNWTVFGYNKQTDSLVHPVRILGSGKNAGIYIRLKMRKRDIDYACREDSNGYRLMLHTPDEMPQVASHYIKIPFDVRTMISVKPRVMSTSENLKHYKPKKRQCFFSGEKRLKYFKAYTQSNCKLECYSGE